MDSKQFDQLVRGVYQSRRLVLGAGAVAGVAPWLAGAKKRKKKKKKPAPPTSPGCEARCDGGRVCRAGTCECPIAAPHWCAAANACVPACPTGSKYDATTCGCDCAVLRSCCQCTGGSNPFCTTALNDPNDCISVCVADNPGGTPFFAAWNRVGFTGVCDANERCEVTCAPASGRRDACQETGGTCQGDLQPFQPLGGGPTRCGRPTDTPSCGCTSHQACADAHGIGAFCVEITGPRCSCGTTGSFCATQA